METRRRSPGLEGDGLVGEDGVGEHAEDGTVAVKGDDLRAAKQKHGIVTGELPGERHAAAVGEIEDAEGEGDEAAGGKGAGERLVKAMAEARGAGFVGRKGAQRGLEVGGDERGGHAFAGDVGEAEGDASG